MQEDCHNHLLAKIQITAEHILKLLSTGDFKFDQDISVKVKAGDITNFIINLQARIGTDIIYLDLNRKI